MKTVNKPINGTALSGKQAAPAQRVGGCCLVLGNHRRWGCVVQTRPTPPPHGGVLGEPHACEGANATESEPKRAVACGGQSPAAKQSAATLCEWAGDQPAVCGSRPKQEPAKPARSAALAEGCRALRGRPRACFGRRWRSEATKGEFHLAGAASSRASAGLSPPGDRPQGAQHGASWYSQNVHLAL